MKILPSVLLLVALPALADQKPWPQKGDIIYVSAELVYSRPGFSLTGGSPDKESPIPSCIAMTVRKVKAEKPMWIIGPAAGPGSVRLEGDWLSRFHRSGPECEKKFAAHGQPKFTRMGWIHTIAKSIP